VAKILIVDDDPTNRLLMRTVLSFGGHDCVEAVDGQDGLAKVRAERPRLVICDIVMPTMDGYEFVRQLRADPLIADTQVIFHTATFLEFEARNLAQSCGVRQILVKPYEPDATLRVIELALNAQAAVNPLPDEADFERQHSRLVSDKLAAKVVELEHTNQRLAALTALNLQLASEHDSGRLLDKFCRGARDLLGACCALLRVEAPLGEPVPYLTQWGLPAAEAQQLHDFLLDVPAARQAMQGRSAVRFQIPHPPQSARVPPSKPGAAQSCLLAPIVSLDHQYGWILLVDKLGAAGFSEEDELNLAAHAAQTGRIYESSRLYTQVQAQVAELRIQATERAEAEHLLRLEHAVIRELAAAQNIAAGLTAALRLVCASQQWSLGVFWRHDGAVGALRFDQYWCDEDPGALRYVDGARSVLFGPQVGLWGKAWQSGRPLWSNDFSNDPRALQTHLARDTGMRGTFVVPVGTPDDTLGVLAFISRQVREPDDKWLATARVVGSQVEQFLRRQQAEADLQRSERFNRATLDSLRDHICVLDEKGTITAVNRAWNDYGRSNSKCAPATQEGSNYLAVCDVAIGDEASDAALFAAGAREVLAGRRDSFNLEYPCHSPTEQRWFNVQVTRFIDSEPLRVVVAHSDVTERKLAETFALSIRTISERMMAGAPVAEVAERIVNLIEDQIPSSHCSLMFLDSTGTRLERAVAPHLPAAFNAAVDGITIGEQVGSCGTAAWLGQRVVAENVATDPRWAAWRDMALANGLQACWSTPVLTVDRKVLGTFAVYHPFARAPLARELEMVDTVTHLTALLIEREHAERALLRSEGRYRSLVAATALITWTLDAQGRCCEDLPTWRAFTGQSHEAILGDGWLTALHPDDRARLTAQRTEAASRCGSFQSQYRLRRHDGVYRHVQVQGVPVVRADESIGEWMGTCTDITDRLLAEQKIDRLHRVSAVLSDINALIVRVRGRDELFREVCRMAVEVGRFTWAWLGTIDRTTQRITLQACTGGNDAQREATLSALARPYTTWPRAADELIDGARPVIFWESERAGQRVLTNQPEPDSLRSFIALPLVAANQTVACLVLHATVENLLDIDELKLLQELAADVSFALEHIAQEERLNYLAYYDSLTGLANDTLFGERVSQHLASARGGKGRLAVALIDLERFKSINDSLGRHVGDALLKQVAARLTAWLGDSKQLARIGADHFAAVLPDVASESDVARQFGLPLRQSLAAPFQVDGQVLHLSVKVGISMFPNDGDSAEALFRNAEAAVKRAKTAPEAVLFYNPKMTESVAEKLKLENMLRRALENDEFVLYYQPKVNTVTRRIEAVEALIRWASPELGLVPPLKFIPLMEETGLILEVGQWALRRAATDCQRLQGLGFEAPRIAVNVSAVQLRRHDFVTSFDLASQQGGQRAGIDVEITESLIMEDIQGNVGKLHALRAMGVQISIDDFGTGYSSLAYLARLPAQILKIDRAFVMTMLIDESHLTLVSTMISLAHSLKMKVVAEGVETEAEARMLLSLGCDQMQGYLFSRPVPFEALCDLLAAQQADLLAPLHA
jgi:diguanylate cyclase (GGDEF)-like protein/PAS domain S-box-containing protein